ARRLPTAATAAALVRSSDLHVRSDGACYQRRGGRAPTRRPDYHVYVADRLRRLDHLAVDVAHQREADVTAVRHDAARLFDGEIFRATGARALREDSRVLLAHRRARRRILRACGSCALTRERRRRS